MVSAPLRPGPPCKCRHQPDSPARIRTPSRLLWRFRPLQPPPLSLHFPLSEGCKAWALLEPRLCARRDAQMRVGSVWPLSSDAGGAWTRLCVRFRIRARMCPRRGLAALSIFRSLSTCRPKTYPPFKSWATCGYHAPRSVQCACKRIEPLDDTAETLSRLPLRFHSLSPHGRASFRRVPKSSGRRSEQKSVPLIPTRDRGEHLSHHYTPSPRRGWPSQPRQPTFLLHVYRFETAARTCGTHVRAKETTRVVLFPLSPSPFPAIRRVRVRVWWCKRRGRRAFTSSGSTPTRSTREPDCIPARDQPDARGRGANLAMGRTGQAPDGGLRRRGERGKR